MGLAGAAGPIVPTSVAVVVLAVGALSGLLGAVVMTVPMSRHSEGFTPAYVAASVLGRTDPESLSVADAILVHHAAGVLAGLLYATVALSFATATGVDPSPAGLAGAPLAHLAAVAVVVAFVYAFFAYLVLPRAGRRISEERATAVRGQWLRASLLFGAAIALLAPGLYAVLA